MDYNSTTGSKIRANPINLRHSVCKLSTAKGEFTLSMRALYPKRSTNEDGRRSLMHYLDTLCSENRMDPPSDCHVNFLSLVLLYRCFWIVFAFEGFFLVSIAAIVFCRMASFRAIINIVALSELAANDNCYLFIEEKVDGRSMFQVNNNG